MRALWMMAWAIVALVGAGGSAAAIDLPKDRLEVTTDRGSGLLPLFLSSPWDRPQPDVVRALIVFHGLSGNGKRYFDHAKKAAALAGEAGRRTFIVVPQFLIEADLDTGAPADAERLLRWRRRGDWIAGWPARRGPARSSSFDAIDAILARLADRAAFPNLAQVVLAGHSAGGQLVQRHAIVGRGAGRLASLGVRVRYVVANPSSYAYLTDERPRRPSRSCRRTFDDWKYGMKNLPPYAAGGALDDLKRAYLERDVVYLLGTNDDDPNDDDLDTRCQARAQGHNRLARGASFFAYLQRHHAGSGHRLQLVFGVEHDARDMFTSPCGLAVLFDLAGCGR